MAKTEPAYDTPIKNLLNGTTHGLKAVVRAVSQLIGLGAERPSRH